MSLRPLSVLFPARSVYMADDPALFTPGAVQNGSFLVEMATNMRIEDGRWRTRQAWRELSLTDAPQEWLSLTTQGSVWYNPRLGSGPEQVDGEAGIVESAAGKLFKLIPEKTTFSVKDISSGVYGRPSMRLAWLCCGENYVIRTDNVSLTQIYDGNRTFTSTGYRPNDPDASRLPNYAGPVAYTDRFWIVNKQRDLIAGDHLHRVNQDDASDLLKTTDQSYDSTAKSFPPPANLGNIHGLFVVTGDRGGGLPSQAEVMASTDGPGTWGVVAGVPRAEWAKTPMARIVHPETGPTGPYAAAPGRNELLMRTLEGVTSLKYFSREAQTVANPFINLGQEIKPLLDDDPPDLLLFASVVNAIRRQRVLFTVAPKVCDEHRWHRGFVSATTGGTRARMSDDFLWEGLQTLPKAMGEVIQFIASNENATRRVFALVRKCDGTKGLVEWTDEDMGDVLADGTVIPQTWQILTRRLTTSEYLTHHWSTLYLRLMDVQDSVQLRISARGREHDPFKEIWCRKWVNANWNDPGYMADPDPITLGSVKLDTPWVQLLIEGRGCCSIDLAFADTDTGNPNDRVTSIRDLAGAACNYDLFVRAEEGKELCS